MNSNQLFQQQYDLLLSELLQIINEKWPLSINSGHTYLREIIETYRTIYSDSSRENEAGENEATTDLTDFYQNKLVNLRRSNQLSSRLKETLHTLEIYSNRLVSIEKSLNSLFKMGFDEIQIKSAAVFKENLSGVISCFRDELRLKTQIVESLLFKSRHDESSQVALISLWIHQPYLNDLQINMFISALKSSTNKS